MQLIISTAIAAICVFHIMFSLSSQSVSAARIHNTPNTDENRDAIVDAVMEHHRVSSGLGTIVLIYLMLIGIVWLVPWIIGGGLG